MKINKKKAWKYGLISGLSVAIVSLITVPSLVSCSSLKNNNNNNTNNASSGASGSETGQSFHNFKNSNQKVVTNGYLASGLKLVNNIAQEPEQLNSLSDYYNLNPSDTPITINPETHNTSWTKDEALNYLSEQMKEYTVEDYAESLETNIKHLYQIANYTSGCFNWTKISVFVDQNGNTLKTPKDALFRTFLVSKINNVSLNEDGKLSFNWDTSMVTQAKWKDSKQIELQWVFNNNYHYSDLSFSPNLLASNNNVSSFLTPTSYKVTNTLSTSNIINYPKIGIVNIQFTTGLNQTNEQMNQTYNTIGIINGFYNSIIGNDISKSPIWNSLADNKILQTKTQDCLGNKTVDVNIYRWKEKNPSLLNSNTVVSVQPSDFEYTTKKVSVINNFWKYLYDTKSNIFSSYKYYSLSYNSITPNIDLDIFTNSINFYKVRGFVLPALYYFGIWDFNNPVYKNGYSLYMSNRLYTPSLLDQYFLPSFPIQPSGKIALNFGNIESITKNYKSKF